MMRKAITLLVFLSMLWSTSSIAWASSDSRAPISIKLTQGFQPKSNAVDVKGFYRLFTVDAVAGYVSAFVTISIDIDGTPAKGLGAGLQYKIEAPSGGWDYREYDESDGGEFWMDDLQRVIIKLDTRKLKNGSHTLDYSITDGQRLNYSTSFNFKSSNTLANPLSKARLGAYTPSIYEYDAILGKPLTLNLWWENPYTRNPASVSFSIKKNGSWVSVGTAKKILWNGSEMYESRKNVTLSSDTWIKTSLVLDSKVYTREFLLKPQYYLDAQFPSKVIVGKAGKAVFNVTGLQSANCGVQITFRNFQGSITKTQDYAVNLRRETAQVQVNMNVSGSIKGVLTCYPANKPAISSEFSWVVSYG